LPTKVGENKDLLGTPLKGEKIVTGFARSIVHHDRIENSFYTSS
jgi:hypothetical protein